jgi:GT2 family glycosyltransferase
MKRKVGISAVIPNWNGKELLKSNLPSLIEALDYHGGDCEIIVVDDASTDGSPQFITNTYPLVRLVTLQRRHGFSGAVNSGVNVARYDMLLLLNSDIRVQKDFLSPLLTYFDDDRTFAVSNKAMKDENAALTRPHYMEFRYGFMREVYMAKSKENEPSYAFGASGGHALFDRKKFLQLGGFDEIYSPFYYEDADLSYRAWKRGYRVYYEPNSIVYHEHQGTIGKSFSKRYISFIFNRNKLIFLWKNLTDSKIIFQHCLSIPAYLLWNLRKNPFIFLSFFAALVKLPAVLSARKSEKVFIRYGDREVLNFIRAE